MTLQEKIQSMKKYGVASIPDADILNSSELMAHACSIYPGYISKLFNNNENIVVPPKKIIKLLSLISQSFSLEIYQLLPLEYQLNHEVLCKVLANSNNNPHKSNIITHLEPSLYKNKELIKFLLKENNYHLDMFDLSQLSDKEIITGAPNISLLLDYFQESIFENNRLETLLEFNPRAIGSFTHDILLEFYKQKPDLFKNTLNNIKNNSFNYAQLPHEILHDENFFKDISYSLIDLGFLHPSYSLDVESIKNKFSETQIAYSKGLPFEIKHHPEIQEMIIKGFATITDNMDKGFISDERIKSLKKIQNADSIDSLIESLDECNKFLNFGPLDGDSISGRFNRIMGLIPEKFLNDKDFIIRLLDSIEDLESSSIFIWSELPYHLKIDKEIMEKTIFQYPDNLHNYLNNILTHLRNEDSIFSDKNKIVIDIVELFNAHPPVSSTVFSSYSADFVSGFLWFKDIEKVFEKTDTNEPQAKASVLDMLDFLKALPIVKEDFLMKKKLKDSNSLLSPQNNLKTRKF